MWEFIKKNWKWLLGILGLGAGTIIASEIINKPAPQKIPEPDIKPKIKKVEAENVATKEKIDATTEKAKQKVTEMTPEQAIDLLPPKDQDKIEKIKKDTTNQVVNNIMSRIDKEVKND